MFHSMKRSLFGSIKYDIPEEIKNDKHLGGKTIGYAGSIVYSVNNISGPGMLAIPLCLQQGLSSYFIIFLTSINVFIFSWMVIPFIMFDNDLDCIFFIFYNAL